MTIKAVLTGDLIHSQAAGDTQAYINALKAVLDDLKTTFRIEAEIFRGDGFQAVPTQPAQVFKCAVALRAGLIAASPAGERWDARVSIGIGLAQVTHHYGEAFVLSGHGLDGMKRNTLGVFSSFAQLLERVELTTEFVAAIIDRWSVVEARTYYVHLLQGTDQMGTAQTLGKSRVTVNKALQRAHARLLDRFLIATHDWIEALNHG